MTVTSGNRTNMMRWRQEPVAEPEACEPTQTQIAAAAWLSPTPEMLADSRFEAIWQCIKRWDVNVPDVYTGYCGANGNHVRAILDALTAAAEVGDNQLVSTSTWDTEKRRIWAVAIERCAQEVTWFGNVANYTLEDIIARVRAAAGTEDTIAWGMKVTAILKKSERERCAQVADAHGDWSIAHDIRALADHPERAVPEPPPSEQLEDEKTCP